MAALIVVGVTSVCTAMVGAQLTSPTAGAVYRDGAVPINEDTGGRFVKADGVTPMSSAEMLSCTFRSSSNPNGRTARGLVTVTRDSDDVVVFSAQSPNKSSLPTALNDQSGAWATSWVIPADAPAGTYTIRSSAENRRRVSLFNPCQLENVTFPAVTIEYRPWQQTFRDLFGGGSVSMNLDPAEFQVKVGSNSGAITPGAGKMTFFAVPGADTVLLPADPAACATDPNLCLPAGALSCNPAAGCDPRLVLISHDAGSEALHGFFDIDTGAFVALAKVNNVQRLMLSLGREQDAAYGQLLADLAVSAAQNGVDLPSLLATTVLVNTGTDELSLSLLNGLQITPSSTPLGVQISTAPTVQAGLVLDIYASLSSSTCATQSGDSDPATPAPDRFAHTADVGYTVRKSDLLPEVPRVGAVGALVGGPIYHITGDFVGASAPILNTATAVIGADTAAGEPNGLPVRVQPFLSSPPHIASPRTMQFLGTATWSASETSLGALGCLSVNFMLGAGVAVFDSPIPLDLGALPIWDPADPAVAALVDSIDAAIAEALGGVTSDPTVSALLEQITGALPVVPGVPL